MKGNIVFMFWPQNTHDVVFALFCTVEKLAMHVMHACVSVNVVIVSLPY